MDAIKQYRIESKYYDLFYGDRVREVHFYSSLASSYGKRVLELGVGTAALAIPLASEGCDVTGIDNSPDMLAVAEEKLSRCDQPVRQRLRLVNADMRSFDLVEKNFDFTFIASNTFLHLLTHEEELNCLRCIREHLRPKGGLAICILQMDPKYPCGVLKLGHVVKVPDDNVELIRYHQESNDYARQLIEARYIYVISENGIGRTIVTDFRLRILLRGELELLLDKSEFDVINVFGSFEKEPHDTTSKSIIALAEKR